MNGKLKNNLIIFSLIGIVVIGGFAFYWIKNSSAPGSAGVGGVLNYQKKDVAGATTIGDPNAPVTVYEFSDFECSYCASFAMDTFPQVKEKYIDTGKVKWVYKFFPLPFHKEAKPAAEASLCAATRGKFWEYHDVIFKNQSDISKNDLKKYAKELGLNEQEFNYCLDKEFYKDEVEKDVSEGQSKSVRGTPTFFIGSTGSPEGSYQMVSGAQHFDVFSQVIDGQLK